MDWNHFLGEGKVSRESWDYFELLKRLVLVEGSEQRQWVRERWCCVGVQKERLEGLFCSSSWLWFHHYFKYSFGVFLVCLVLAIINRITFNNKITATPSFLSFFSNDHGDCFSGSILQLILMLSCCNCYFHAANIHIIAFFFISTFLHILISVMVVGGDI